MKSLLCLVLGVLLTACTGFGSAYRPTGDVAPVSEPKTPPCQLKGGVIEPFYPPYCWVSPPGDTLWYPCGQCRTDEEMGKHGH